MADQDCPTRAALQARLDDLNTEICNSVYDVHAIVSLAKAEAWSATAEFGANGSDAADRFNHINRALDVAATLLNAIAAKVDEDLKIKPTEVSHA